MNADRRGALEEVCGPVSRETYARLETFADLFLKWSARINLAAPGTLDELWTRHILDSAQVVGIAPTARQWIDLGSGGGFPGVVTAILMMERGGHVDLVESNRKKAAFLQIAVEELPAHVHAGRIDEVLAGLQTPDVVTARALAPLPRLLPMIAPQLRSPARAILHKGREFRSELQESAADWRFDLVEHASKTDSDAALLEISNLRRRADDSETSS